MTDDIPEIKTHPKLGPGEQETTIRFAKADDRATVYSDEPGIVRRLMKHPMVETLETNEYDGFTVGAKFEMPIGLLKITQSGRSSSGHANVVTNQF